MIKCFRLITGEDVISEVKEQPDTNSIIASGAFRIVMHQTQQGLGMSLVPLVFANPEAELEIEKSKILYFYSAEDEIVSQYRQFTTGLVTPSSSVLLG